MVSLSRVKRGMLSSELMQLQARTKAVRKTLALATVIVLALWVLDTAAQAVPTRATAETESGIYITLLRPMEPGADVSYYSIYTICRPVNASNLARCIPIGDHSGGLLDSADNEAVLPRPTETPRLNIQGYVSDAQTHKPLSGARVVLERRNPPPKNEAPSNEPTLTAVTDKKGHFRLERVEPGFYMLSVLDPAYVPLYRRSVELSAQDRSTRLDVSLDPMVHVLGRVVDESDRRIPNAGVGIAIDFESSSDVLRRVLRAYGKSGLMTRTGDQGEFELFVPGEEERITLVAKASGYVLGQLGPVSLQPDNARKSLVLRLSRGLSASGRVIDETGAPIAGATIVALEAEAGEPASELPDVRPRATSGADGSYVLWGLQKGVYELTVSEATHTHPSVTVVEIRSAQRTRLPDIVLLAEADIRGRVVDVDRQPIVGARITSDFAGTEPNEAISDEQGGFVLRGFVNGAKGNVSAAAVGYGKITKAISVQDRDVVLVLQQTGMLHGRAEDAETRIPIKSFRIRKTFGSTEKSFQSEDGVFEWADLQIGRWTFVAEAKGYQAAELVDVEIRTGEPSIEVVFPLVKGAKLTGRIVNAATGSGIPDARVSFRVDPEIESVAWHDRADRNERKTDADGSFELDNLPYGRVMIVVTAPLNHAATQRIVIAGEERFVEISLSIGSSISGRVLSSDGTVLPSGATVWLGSPATSMSRAIPIEADGLFSFGDLAAGAYRLTAEAPGLGKSPPQDIILREDERRTDLELRFVARIGTTLRVRIIGLFPGEVAWLTAQGEGGFINDSPIYDRGAYVIPGVPEGSVELTVVTSSQRQVERSIEILRGASEVTFDIQFPREARLAGRVTQKGRPVGNQRVIVSSNGPNGIIAVARTDPSGVYTIEGLSNGDYRVAVEGGVAHTVRVSGDSVLDIELP